MPDTDVAVIGGGPAGVAAALSLREAGLAVTLVDPGRGPVPRIESLAANGIALARSCGMAGALDAAGLGRAAAMHLHWRGRPETRPFAADGPLLLDRSRFHAALRRLLPPASLRAARVTAIADGGEHVLLATSTGAMAARFVIDARGRAGLKARPQGTPVMAALAFGGRGAPPSGQPAMLLEALAEGWLWAALLPHGEVNGALFLPAARLAGGTAATRARCLADHLRPSALGLPAALRAGPVSASMLVAVADPFLSPRVLRVGDAALANDPLASHGIVHALRSGVQAAAAAATLLDPAGDAGAARSFIRDRHRMAASSARDATRRSLADQARFATGFWSAMASAEAAGSPAPPPWPALTRPLALAPLVRSAVLEHGRIAWADALWLPRSAQAVPRLGPFPAGALARLLSPPAAVTVLSERLARIAGEGQAQAILRLLLEEGALGNAAPAQPGVTAGSNA
ncbi:flavin-dependent monooxygenase QhpG [Aestuariivirga litoralis]|uniref:flavin-dependent monooxygenase QhpG n=1 Tax=Aestuariivirga litoralis TaxID=2650924 RepID=UPI001379F35F|nr:FAD-dependent monooxygenase [Aestuariivirga litoralis]